MAVSQPASVSCSRIWPSRLVTGPKALSTYVGHSSIAITLDRYGHLMPGNEAAAAELLDAYLARAEVQS